nr:MAG TPA: hypothetical protein [Bacteriophage sp.]
MPTDNLIYCYTRRLRFSLINQSVKCIPRKL